MAKKIDLLDQPATQSGFAELVGVSQQAISDKIEKAGLRAGGTYRQWLVSYCEHFRQLAAGRGAADDQANAARAKTRESTANAQLKELLFQREVGNLVPVDELEPLLESWAVTARSEMTYAIDKLIAAIQSKHNIEVEQGLIDDTLGAAFTSIAGYPSNLAGITEPGGDEVAAT